jgi:hypothetical protein
VYPASPSNGLAIASLICSILGLVTCCVTSFVGIGLGIAGLNQSKRTGVGRGLSIAGIAVGSAWVVLGVVVLVALVAAGHNHP